MKWVRDYLWKAEVVFDKFHLMTMMNDIIDSVRKRCSKSDKALKKSKLLLLKNWANLKEKQANKLEEILKNNSELLEVHTFKTFLQEFYNEDNTEEAELTLDVIIELMKESWIAEINKFGRSLEKNKQWILNYWINKTTNAVLESINSQIQSIKKIARWFKNIEYFKSIIYIKLWKLNLSCLNPLL